jgi:hypothetical protein
MVVALGICVLIKDLSSKDKLGPLIIYIPNPHVGIYIVKSCLRRNDHV